jgi:hypothetical protein
MGQLDRLLSDGGRQFALEVLALLLVLAGFLVALLCLLFM